MNIYVELDIMYVYILQMWSPTSIPDYELREGYKTKSCFESVINY